MALKGCPAVIKYLVFFFNLIFWLIGIALIALGVWVLVDDRFVAELGEQQIEALRVSAIIIICVGSLIMLTGFLGCCGAIRESQCCLVLFFILLTIMFLIILAVAIVAIFATSMFEKAFRNTLLAEVDGDGSTGLLPILERTLECCGANGMQDYNLIDMSAACKLAIKKKTIPPGCAEAGMKVFKDKSVWVIAITIGVCAVLLLGIVFACVLCCSIRRQSRYLVEEDY